jgi:hypothetical protein
MGRPPGRPGRRVATRARELVPAGGNFTHLPRASLSLGLACATDACANAAAREVKPGAGWGIRVASPAAVVQIREGGRNPQVPKPPTPLGFSLLSSPVSAP